MKTKSTQQRKRPLFLEVHKTEPEGFLNEVEVAACYVEVNSKILLLQICPQKKEAGSWGVPAGKMEINETALQAARRELFEETGITIEPHYPVESLGALYIRKPEVDYIYHLFRIKLEKLPDVHLSAEHQAYKWALIDEIKQLPLMNGALEALDHYAIKL